MILNLWREGRLDTYVLRRFKISIYDSEPLEGREVVLALLQGSIVKPE
jgi:hypothetical protein